MAFVCENVRQQLPWLWGLYKCETGRGVALLVENLTSVLEGLSLIPAPHKPGVFMCCNPGMQQVEAGRLEGHCHPYQFKASLASVRREPLLRQRSQGMGKKYHWFQRGSLWLGLKHIFATQLDGVSGSGSKLCFTISEKDEEEKQVSSSTIAPFD